MTTYVALRIVDLRSLIAHTYTLGTIDQLRPSFTLGSDPSCDLILPGAPARSLCSNDPPHWFISGERGRLRVDRDAFAFGPYELQIVDDLPAPIGGPPSREHQVQFGPGSGLGVAGSQGAPEPIDPSDARVREIFHRIITTPKLDRLDASWIAGKLHDHLAQLAAATAPRPRLVPGHITYARSYEQANPRYETAWQFAAIAPAIPSAYAYVHRIAVWDGEHLPDRYGPQAFARALRLAGWASEAAHHVGELVYRARHVDGADPWTPLLDLAAPGVTVIAMPDASFIAVIPTLAAEPPADDAELLTRDPAVLADLLEQRGELMRAARVRANQLATERRRLDTVEHLFPIRGFLLSEAAGKIPPHTATGVPPAELELGETHMPLTTATTELDIRDGALVTNGGRGLVDLVYDAPVLYARARGHHTVVLDGRSLTPGIDIPLFDRDVLVIAGVTITVRISDAA